MERALIVSHGWLDSMFPPKFKFNQGDGIKSKGGLISGGSGGLEPLAWALGNSKNVWTSSWKYARFQNLGSSEVSKWYIYMCVCVCVCVCVWWVDESHKWYQL